MRFQLFPTLILAALSAVVSYAQEPNTSQLPSASTLSTGDTPAKAGPHGGSLKMVGELQVETVVDQSGIQMYVLDRQGSTVAVAGARGAVTLRVEGSAKRYRYDLLPDGKGGLLASVNLSKIAGRQIEIDVQLVGIDKTTIRFDEVATVPMSESQFAAAAIARQKICPVSGKPLGSMGQPISVEVNERQVFVCCAGCVNAVKANPKKYVSGRPEISVTTASAADASAIAKQKVCPVMDESLGSMGKPIKVMVGDKPIYLCCKGCIKKVQAEPAKYVAKVYGDPKGASVSAGNEAVREGVYKIADEDSAFIAAQKKCPVMDEPLDAMGGPYKVHANGKAIYICCPGCAKRIAAEPEKYIAVLNSQGVEPPAIR